MKHIIKGTLGPSTGHALHNFAVKVKGSVAEKEVHIFVDALAHAKGGHHSTYIFSVTCILSLPLLYPCLLL